MNRTICFIVMAAIAVSVTAVVACGPIKNCGAFRVREDGARCRECVDQDGRFNECGMTVTEQR